MRSAVAERQGMTKDVAIDLDVAGDVPTVETDPSVVRLIVIELLDNAVKYSSGEAPVVVRVNRSGDADVLIDIENEGVALDGDIDPFAPFARGREARRLAGSGLGLFIAKRLSGHIAAELTAHSRPSGARFALWIPSGGRAAPAS